MKVFGIVAVTMLLQLSYVLNLPPGCRDVGGIVLCEDLRKFPRSLVTDAQTVTIANSQFAELPSHAFAGLSQLTNLTMYLVTIKTIKACAFSSMNNLYYFDLMFSNIGTIESNAFNNISGKSGGKLNFFMLNIEHIQPYAFNTIEGFDYFSIDMVRITSIQSYAFNDIQPRVRFTITRTNMTTIRAEAFQDFKTSVKMSKCTIHSLGCHTFDLLHRDLGDHFQLNSIKFSCNCDLAWFANAVQETPAIVGDDVACFEPAELANINLTNISQRQLCNRSNQITCDPSGVAPPIVSDICENNIASGYQMSFVFLVFFIIFYAL